MKRTISIILALVLFAALFTACGKSGKTDGKTKTPVNLPASMEALKTAGVGDVIQFGRYPYEYWDNDTKETVQANELHWLVIDKTEDSVLLICKNGIVKPYHDTLANVTWETCTLRKWLNNDFLTTAFTAEEQAAIKTSTVTADKNEYFVVNPGNDTQDKVFVLSFKEAEKYFRNDEALRAQGITWTWTRTPGETNSKAVEIYSDGVVEKWGYDVNQDSIRCNPVIWVQIG